MGERVISSPGRSGHCPDGIRDVWFSGCFLPADNPGFLLNLGIDRPSLGWRLLLEDYHACCTRSLVESIVCRLSGFRSVSSVYLGVVFWSLGVCAGCFRTGQVLSVRTVLVSGVRVGFV